MNTVERYRAAFLGQTLDRVPIYVWLGIPLLQRMTGKSPLALLKESVSNPLEIIRLQEGLGLDPVLLPTDERWFSMHRYWRLLYSWSEAALRTWRVHQEVLAKGDGFADYRFVAETPQGPLTWGYEVRAAQVHAKERPLKEETDLDRIQYMPAPEDMHLDRLVAMVRTTGERAFVALNLIGVWGEAANMRGLSNIAMDIYERPQFVHRLSEFLTERAIRRVAHLAKSGIHSVIYDQSWVGLGFSPAVYREFMLPYDRRVVQAAIQAGLLVSYHNCGRGMLFLEDMVSTGANALEPLTPKENSGDFDLAEVKRRVGGRITLNGGFNERVLASGTPQQVREHVQRCLNVAAAGGRYVLRTCGQVFEAAPGNLETLTRAGREYGRY